MKVLLVWEQVPETTSVYLLDEGPIADAAIKAHNHYVNAEDGEPAEELANFLKGLTALPDDTPPQINEPVTVVLSGFIM